MTQGRQPVERRLDAFERKWKRSRRTEVAWFLGGTLILILLIFKLADVGLGLIETQHRLDNLEKQIEQVVADEK